MICPFSTFPVSHFSSIDSIGFNIYELTAFGKACYLGSFDTARKVHLQHFPLQPNSLKLQAVESGTAPDLEGTETTYKFGYATLVIAGSQRVEPISGGRTQHYEVLKYLLSCGLPPNVPDICGFTALHHSVIGESIHCKEDLIRVLIQSGANVNCQNRYGEVPLFGAMQRNDILGIELLMEYGADVHIAEADGKTPDGFYLVCGPQVTAAFKKWIGKRKGEEAPRVEKRCDACGDPDKPLKNCSQCHVARYCSTECQSIWILFSFSLFLTPIFRKGLANTQDNLHPILHIKHRHPHPIL